MAKQIQIDWTVTIEEDGVLIIENDIRVDASICGDGEILIDDIQLIKHGKPQEIGGVYVRPILALIPFLDSPKPWLAALAARSVDVLLEDERFTEAVMDDARAQTEDYELARADYLYDLAGDR